MALIKCKECGKTISDEAKSCPNCGSPTEKSKNKRVKIFKLAFTIGIIIVALIVFCLVFIGVRHNSDSYIYGQQAISIINDFKERKISNHDAIKQLDSLRDEIKSVTEEMDSESNKYQKLFMIRIYVDGASNELLSLDGPSSYELDEIINSIKKKTFNFYFLF